MEPYACLVRHAKTGLLDEPFDVWLMGMNLSRRQTDRPLMIMNLVTANPILSHTFGTVLKDSSPALPTAASVLPLHTILQT